MATTSDYLTQLESDRQDLVDNLETKGITGLTGDETFTELVPEVLNISGGGSTPTGTINIIENGTTDVTNYASAVVNVPNIATQYTIAGSTNFTLNASNWNDNIYQLNVSGYTVDANSLQIGFPAGSSTANAINVMGAALKINQYISNTIYIEAMDTPAVNLQITIFGVTSS